MNDGRFERRRAVRAELVVVEDVLTQHPLKVVLVHHDEVIGALPPRGADHTRRTTAFAFGACISNGRVALGRVRLLVVVAALAAACGGGGGVEEITRSTTTTSTTEPTTTRW